MSTSLRSTGSKGGYRTLYQGTLSLSVFQCSLFMQIPPVLPQKKAQRAGSYGSSCRSVDMQGGSLTGWNGSAV